jgi:iron complex outermembrane recepter protein
MVASMPAHAQVVGARADDDIVVTGTLPDTQLDAESEVGSRSGLSNREIPATLTVIDQAALLERGARTTVEALNAVPGVVSGGTAQHPGRHLDPRIHRRCGLPAV